MGWFSRHAEEQVAIVADRQEQIAKDMRQTAKDLSALSAALVVREPATATAAQAYDGLRKAVMAGAQARRELLVDLVELTELLDHDVEIEDIRSFVEELRLRAHLAQDGDVAARPAHFTVLDGVGDTVRVNKVAWVDEQTGALIKRGLAERVASQGRALPIGETEVAEAASVDPQPDAPAAQESRGGDKVAPVHEASDEVPATDVRASAVEAPEQELSQSVQGSHEHDAGAGSLRASPEPQTEQVQATPLPNETNQARGAAEASEGSTPHADHIETMNEDGQGK